MNRVLSLAVRTVGDWELSIPALRILPGTWLQ
jgi:hypothetical protein